MITLANLIPHLTNRALVLFLLFVCGHALGQLQSAIVLENADFEVEGDCAGDWGLTCAQGFRAHQSSASNSVVDLSGGEFANQKLSIQLGAKPDMNLPAYAAATQSISLNAAKAGAQYHLSVWVRADNLNGKSILFAGTESAEKAIMQSEDATNLVYGPSGYSAWTQLNLAFTVPSDESRLTIGLAAFSEVGQCVDAQCGTVYFDNLSLKPLATSSSANEIPVLSNVCSDGYFLNTLTEQCQWLDKQFGYTPVQKPSAYTFIECENISSSNINAAIQSFGLAGGLIELDACRAPLTDDVEFGSNITLAGAGVGRTVLYREPNWKSKASTLLRVRGEQGRPVKNVILRDFTVKGSGPQETAMNNIQVKYAHNMLVERLETRDAGKSGISVRSSQKVTLRYVVGHGSVRWHGIESKDCYLHASLDTEDNDFLVSRDECAVGTPDFYTENIAIYSSTLFNNRGLGIDSHASFAEIAGNRSYNNGSASKLPEPANNLWVHHNEFSDSSREGMKIALQMRLGDETLVPFNQVIYKNLFRRNRGYGIRIHDRAHNIYLVDNQFKDNDHRNRLRIVPGVRKVKRVHICPSDQSASFGIDGRLKDYVLLEASDSKCNLDNVATIFSN